MKMKKLLWLWIALLVFLLAGSAFIYSRAQAGPQTPLSGVAPIELLKAASGAKEPAESGKLRAPDFSLKDLNGRQVSLADYKGKIVVLNFWTTWCTICKKEMPELDQASSILQKRDDVVLLAVNTGEDPETVKQYMKDNAYTLPVLLDPDSTLFKAFGLRAYPTTIVILRDGTVYGGVEGAITAESLLELDKL
ncbi:redoxin domain-containing protein [Paenibacillus sp. HN-1]|uniref:TlpA family protein disulfide reductase n=1 Tax=Paenibacillus TaxID=44249 RepID=UPI001CA7E253|nr:MULTISPECIES: TlpA family protein disulfide reductase [Paenibacillus]MBY9077326.1 redoxin domain-containing protein [Paenibacillus sp. CGMCC 1.18879]MBY9085646.1 redoxin domain-containing protein [Paenibacillus sinensis]